MKLSVEEEKTCPTLPVYLVVVKMIDMHDSQLIATRRGSISLTYSVSDGREPISHNGGGKRREEPIAIAFGPSVKFSRAEVDAASLSLSLLSMLRLQIKTNGRAAFVSINHRPTGSE